MKFVNQNFYHNYLNAIGTSDPEFTQDLIFFELSELITSLDQRKELIEKISNSNVSISKNASASDIINKLIDNLKKNDNLRSNISRLIAEKNYKNLDKKLQNKIKLDNIILDIEKQIKLFYSGENADGKNIKTKLNLLVDSSYKDKQGIHQNIKFFMIVGLFIWGLYYALKNTDSETKIDIEKAAESNPVDVLTVPETISE